MTRFDLNSLAQAAVDLVTGFGATATAVIAGTSQTVTDKAWRGEDVGGDIEVSIELAITDFDEDEIDGDLIRRTDKAGWTFPPTTGENLEEATSIKQGDDKYSIEGIKVIKPANQVIAYRMVLRR